MDTETNDLVKRAKQADSEAFGQLYDRFAQRIFKYIRLKIQNQPEAEDVLQDVFVKAYRGLASLNLQDLNFSAWLYKVAGNTINDYFRKKYRTHESEIIAIDESFDIPSGVSLQHEVEINSEIEMVRQAFDSLPPLYKQVLELRFLQEFDLDEIAKILNKTNLSVRLLQFRALKKVKIILNEKH